MPTAVAATATSAAAASTAATSSAPAAGQSQREPGREYSPRTAYPDLAETVNTHMASASITRLVIPGPVLNLCRP